LLVLSEWLDWVGNEPQTAALKRIEPEPVLSEDCGTRIPARV